MGGLTNWRGTFFSSPTLGFMVSEAGHLVQWDGQSWRQVREGDGVRLRSVFAISPTDVWAVGSSGMVVRYNGSTSTTQRLAGNPELRGVWASSATDVWIVGDSGYIAHWDGNTLMPTPSPTTGSLMAIWGSAADNIFAVTFTGGIVRFNGFGWGLVTPLAGTQSFYAIDGVGAADLVIGGTNVFRSTALPDGGVNANSWTQLPNLPSGFSVRGLEALPNGGVWAVSDDGRIAYWDGTNWSVTIAPSGPSLWTVNVVGTDVYAYGYGGRALRRRGSSWADLVPRDPRHLRRFVTNGAGTEYFALGEGGLALRRSASGDWAPLAAPVASFTTGCFNNGSGVAIDGDGGVYRLTTSGITAAAPSLAAFAPTSYLACGPTTDFYAATAATTWRYGQLASGSMVTGTLSAGTWQGLTELGGDVWGATYGNNLARAVAVDGGQATLGPIFGADVDLIVPRSDEQFVAIDTSSAGAQLYLISRNAGTSMGTMNRSTGWWAASRTNVLQVAGTVDDFTVTTRADADGGLDTLTVLQAQPNADMRITCRGDRCFLGGPGGAIFRKDY